MIATEAGFGTFEGMELIFLSYVDGEWNLASCGIGSVWCRSSE